MKINEFNKICFNIPNSRLEHVIDEYVKGFKAERNKVIVKDKLLRGMTYEEVAEKHDMSVRQVKTIISNMVQMIVPFLG